MHCCGRGFVSPSPTFSCGRGQGEGSDALQASHPTLTPWPYLTLKRDNFLRSQLKPALAQGFSDPSPYLERGLGRGCTLRLKGHSWPTSTATSLQVLSYLFSL